MVDRTVRVNLVAQVNGYLQGMDQAARKTREMGSEAEKLAQKRQAFQTLGTAAFAAGLAIAAGIGLAIVKAAEFDQAMSNANAIVQESVAGQEALRDAALEAGGATVFTATESANAIEELGKAGIATADILSGALTGALDLAASGQLGVARAAEITGITLKQFELDGRQAARVADVLSAGANKAVGSVDDLAQGLKFVGPVAAGMNVSLEDTVATLALFSDRGVIGEQAGTSFRGMLAALTSPSKQAKAELDRLNVALYDGNGRFLGMENAASELHRALAGVTDAERDMSLGVLFGNQQVTAARIVVDAGAETWRDYREAVDDSGIAARIAAERMDNLAGDVEKLGGAFDTALIQTGSGANDVLRGIVQSATFLVDAVGELPEPVLNAGLAIGTLLSVTLLVGGAALTAVPKFAAFREAVKATQIGVGGASLATAGLSAAIGIATFVIGTLIQRQAEYSAGVDTFRDSLDAASGAVTDYTRQLQLKELEERGALDAADRLGFSMDTVKEAAMGSSAAYKELEAQYQELARSANLIEAYQLAADWRTVANAVSEVGNQTEDAQDSWRRLDAASEASAASTRRQERELAALEGRAASTADEIDALADRVCGFGSAQFDLREANRQVEQSIDDLRDSVAQNGLTLDITTQAGRDNQSAMDDLAQAYLDQAAAVGIQQGSLDAALPVLAAGRQAFIDQAVAVGYDREEIEALADQVGLLPENVQMLIDANTTPAQEQIDSFIARNDGKRIRIYADGSVSFGNPNVTARAMGGFENHRVQAFATGGMPSGIYSGGPIYKFAEPHLPWESFISGDPTYRERNIGIWRETGNRLGAWPQAAPAPIERPVQVDMQVVSSDPYVTGELVKQQLAAKLATLG